MSKFHKLRKAGFTAHLDLHAHNGQCWVGLPAGTSWTAATSPSSATEARTEDKSSLCLPQERRQAARQVQAAASVPDSEVPAAEVRANEVYPETATKEAAEETAENAVITDEVEPSESPPPAVEEIESPPHPEKVTESPPPQAEVSMTMQSQDVNPKFVIEEVAQDVANETLYRSKNRVSVSLYLAGERYAEYSDIMKPDRNQPAPFWFCEDIGALQKHHGNVRFFISEQVRKLIGHHPHNIITHTQFLARL